MATASRLMASSLCGRRDVSGAAAVRGQGGRVELIQQRRHVRDERLRPAPRDASSVCCGTAAVRRRRAAMMNTAWGAFLFRHEEHLVDLPGDPSPPCRRTFTRWRSLGSNSWRMSSRRDRAARSPILPDCWDNNCASPSVSSATSRVDECHVSRIVRRVTLGEVLHSANHRQGVLRVRASHRMLLVGACTVGGMRRRELQPACELRGYVAVKTGDALTKCERYAKLK